VAKSCPGKGLLRDAQLLILDEPTAALDARSEFEVFHRFAELTAGKMALFISHRFSTVRSADRILVLEMAGLQRKELTTNWQPGWSLRGDVRDAGLELSLDELQIRELQIRELAYASCIQR